MVVYDELADRWVLSQFAWRRDFRGAPAPPFFQCVAVSRSPDPTAGYARYEFRLPGNSLPDYPKLALWPSAYVLLTYPDLQASDGGRPRLFAMDRSAMIRGDAATAIEFELDRGFGRALPVDLDGEAPPITEPASVVRVTETPPRIELWALLANFAAPEASLFERRAVLPVAEFDPVLCAGGSFCVEQPQTASRLDDLARRLMFRAAYRRLGDDGAIVLNHTVDVADSGRAGIRWYELRGVGSRPVVRQQATYAPVDRESRWAGSIALDRNGGVALGFSVSGADTFPSVGYTGRRANDRLNQMTQGEGRLVTGSAPQVGSGGWGDYSNLVVDPVDGCTFWYTQSYYRTAGKDSWQTVIGSFRLPDCGALPAILGVMSEGQTLGVDDGPWSAPTSRYRYRRCDHNGANCREIPGAHVREYTVSAHDVGSTLRAVIDRSVDDGYQSWMSHATSTIVGAPRDLVLSMSQDRSRLRVGQIGRFAVNVENRGEGTATGVTVQFDFPRGTNPVTFESDRGSCSPTGTCIVDLLGSQEDATIRAEVKLARTGVQSIAARGTQDQPDADPSTNQASVRVAVQSTPTVQILNRPLRLRLVGATAVATGRVKKSEAMQLLARVERNGGRVVLLAGSRLGGRTLGRQARQVTTSISRTRLVPFRLVVRAPKGNQRKPLTLVLIGETADHVQARARAPVSWPRSDRGR